MTRTADRIVFYACVVTLFGLIVQAAYDYGYAEAEKKCLPVVAIPKQQSYPKTKAEMQAFVKAYHNQDRGWVK